MEVKFLLDNLTKMEVDAIVNPANSEGEMGGGVAAAIKKAGGKRIEEEAMEQAPIPIGKAVLTTAGKLNCEYVIHAPTMLVPVQRTSADKVAQATRAALELAKEYELERIAFPGMGTGTGRVPVDDAAKAMVNTIKTFPGVENHFTEIFLVDLNQEMVDAWERCWEAEPEENEAEASDTEETAG
ncbi:MAG: macro domain-containing protein [Calditrichaeota bacterium]|nr:MAG: macro domain-containing protein [Calditrichota bacterium]